MGSRTGGPSGCPAASPWLATTTTTTTLVTLAAVSHQVSRFRGRRISTCETSTPACCGDGRNMAYRGECQHASPLSRCPVELWVVDCIVTNTIKKHVMRQGQGLPI